MRVGQLVSLLADYADREVVVLVDYGAGYLLHPPTGIAEAEGYGPDGDGRVAIVLMDMAEAPIVQWRRIDPVCPQCGLVESGQSKKSILSDQDQLDLFE